MKKITFTWGDQTISVTEVGEPFFTAGNYLYVALKLNTPLTISSSYTVHYGPKSEEDETEYTSEFYVRNTVNVPVPFISTSRGILNAFPASYFPVGETYTGKLYQGTKCLTPDAFPMTLTGAFGSGQVLSYEQSVLDALRLAEGSYTLVVFMGDEIVASLTLEIHYDEIVPAITLSGHYSYTDNVAEENLETWEGAYYGYSYYYGGYYIVADQTGKYRLHAYNYGDYRYFRFADSMTALASAEFQSVGTGYYEGVLSDKTTRGWRTIYAEFSKKGVAGDSSNTIASATLYVLQFSHKKGLEKQRRIW